MGEEGDPFLVSEFLLSLGVEVGLTHDSGVNHAVETTCDRNPKQELQRQEGSEPMSWRGRGAELEATGSADECGAGPAESPTRGRGDVSSSELPLLACP